MATPSLHRDIDVVSSEAAGLLRSGLLDQRTASSAVACRPSIDRPLAVQGEKKSKLLSSQLTELLKLRSSASLSNNIPGEFTHLVRLELPSQDYLKARLGH